MMCALHSADSTLNNEYVLYVEESILCIALGNFNVPIPKNSTFRQNHKKLIEIIVL